VRVANGLGYEVADPPYTFEVSSIITCRSAEVFSPLSPNYTTQEASSAADAISLKG
jgi:hypothetical protein